MPTDITITSETVTMVEKIEEIWYMQKPTDPAVTDRMSAWLDVNHLNDTSLSIDGISFKNFVRSFRLAYERILQPTISPSYTIKEDKKVITQELKAALKPSLSIVVGELEYTIRLLPFPLHLGNCYIDGVGTYSETWPFLALITDNITLNNQNLADSFLTFAKKPFEFKREDLEKINDKFESPIFTDNLINYYCKMITGIAILYVLFEPARRLEIVFDNGQPVTIKPNKQMIHSASMITALKLLRDTNDTTLEQAFSEDSLVLFTKKGVANTSKTKKDASKNDIGTHAAYCFLNKYENWVLDNEIPDIDEIKATLLDPNSADVSGDEADYSTIDTEEAIQCQVS